MERPVARKRRQKGPWLAALWLILGSSDTTVAVSAQKERPAASSAPMKFPWREAGLDERVAAAHLLNRLTYGPRPGEVDRILALGLERWVTLQLEGKLADPVLEPKLAPLSSLKLSTRDYAATYPNPPMVLNQAARAGVIDRQTLADFEAMRAKAEAGEDPLSGSPQSQRQARKAQRDEVLQWAKDQGYRDQREAHAELLAQKLYRATYSENQLREVLTDFWFNHFNVSLSDNDCRSFVATYERDAIRPNVLGSFRDLLGATARHPAMLFYLDNARSVAEDGARKAFERPAGRRGRQDPFEQNRPKGLNENYARELLELHTLGVDGGYDQRDVREVARAFTGWTSLPPGRHRQIEQRLDQARRFTRMGFVVEDAFVFRPDTHDAGAKTVLGTRLPAGRGIEDGEQVLDLLSAHPATARHLATKFATRFISDSPPPALIDRLAANFQSTRGDLRQLMVSLLESPEFWAPAALGQKIKSPFELTVSALRILKADIADPRPTLEWIERMGQPLYSYQAPTGFPDRADAWVNTGSLLNRMNFGLHLGVHQIAGLRFDLVALNGQRQPESRIDALATYARLLMPERPTAELTQELQAMAMDEGLLDKVAGNAPVWEPSEMGDGFSETGPRRRQRQFGPPMPLAEPDLSPLAQVVGVILGSPEFQRR